MRRKWRRHRVRLGERGIEVVIGLWHCTRLVVIDGVRQGI